MQAVVTGAVGGLGEVLVSRLEDDGWDVVGIDLRAAEGVHLCDIADWDAVSNLAKDLGTVDLLVNNAGYWNYSPLEHVVAADFARVLEVNLLGAFHCTKAFGLGMLAAEKGVIVNIASTLARSVRVASGAYSPSKAGLIALTRQTAIEWGPRGVRCNSVSPGLMFTPALVGQYPDDVLKARLSAIPLRISGEVVELTPLHVANAVAFLASQQASHINGEDLAVDGGLVHALTRFLPGWNQ